MFTTLVGKKRAIRASGDVPKLQLSMIPAAVPINPAAVVCALIND
jgi:hypothetical protein